MEDSRFDSVGSDPRFRQLALKQRKVKIDNRFNSMFVEKNFKLKYTVDKRGRRVDTSTNEHLQKLYTLSESEASSSDDSEENEDEEKDDEDKNNKSAPDYARGEVEMSGSSSSSEEEEDDDNADVIEPEMLHDWGELDRDAPKTEETTRRLAVCNMDWDNIKALDLFLLFDGLDKRTSAGGIIQAVKIYPSDYGVERMEKEQAQGPTELVDKELRKKLQSSKIRKGEDEKKVNSELLRKYEMNRLKYYYAVVDCDSAKTASFLYTQLNGCEYELGGQVLDLRFIPDDMTFDREPRDVAMVRPDTSNYKVKKHVIPALQNTTVDLSWDVTPSERLAVTTRKYTNEELESADLKAYLASASEDDEDCYLEERMKSIAEQEGSEGSASDADETTVTESSIKKYRALIESLNKDTSPKNDDEEMEFTWELGVKDKVEKKLKNKDQAEEETPWGKYIEKTKEKKRLKRSEKRKKKRAATAEGGSSEDDDSDDSLPAGVDLNDPYFAEELKSNNEFPSVMSKKKKKHNKNKEMKEEDEAESKRQEAELALLVMVMNDKPDKKREKEEKTKNKKRKRKNVKLEEEIPTKIGDSRFEDIYKSLRYSVDPSVVETKKSRKH